MVADEAVTDDAVTPDIVGVATIGGVYVIELVAESPVCPGPLYTVNDIETDAPE